MDPGDAVWMMGVSRRYGNPGRWMTRVRKRGTGKRDTGGTNTTSEGVRAGLTLLLPASAATRKKKMLVTGTMKPVGCQRGISLLPSTLTHPPPSMAPLLPSLSG
ncbi:hypothetical protein Pmani_005940 [Petrolisthes manimaculis]|uniref:Uncharacterized protein n=1 Tax=Petrolisthes manimaculis TaxID=1843537 RepID=A0AAE1QBD4_9EUCA|nr:hypothetical protein Pmani_005940 [Petrolisthes manimaculis]